LNHDLRLPELETFQYGPLAVIEPLADSAPSSNADAEQTEPVEEDTDDLWRVAFELGPLRDDVRYHSWDAFECQDWKEPKSAYISEAGPEIFDALICEQATQDELGLKAGSVLRSDVFFNSLVALGMGRSSIIFSWNENDGRFVQVVNDSRTSGYSVTAIQHVIHELAQCGSAFRGLSQFVTRSYGSRPTFPAWTALASTVSTILSAVETHLSEQVPNMKSLLQMLNIYNRPRRLLVQIAELVKGIRSTKSNEAMTSMLFQQVQVVEQDDDWLRKILLLALARVTQPWLDLVGQWISLQPDEGYDFIKANDLAFVGEEPTAREDGISNGEFDYAYHSESMPSMISDEDGRIIFETGRSLRLLREHHPDHPLATPSAMPQLEWKFDWKHLQHITQKARDYQQSLISAVRHYQSDNSSHLPVDDHIPLKLQADTVLGSFDWQLDLSNEEFSRPPIQRMQLPDELVEVVRMSLDSLEAPTGNDGSEFSPPISLTPILFLRPLVTAQAGLVNAASLRLFLRSHGLRKHLRLQRNYHLMGDGVFVAALTAALFDPDQASAERRRGVMRLGTSMGLRLGSRKNWPPASSELRLALMGILTEAYQVSPLNSSSQHSGNPASTQAIDLPGNLSFSIRQLSEADIDLCMDPHSLHALDFLRLQYTPPSPLGAVITPASLNKYDTMFKFLLRLTRMLFVISHLPRSGSSTQRLFRQESHHFVVSCSNYFFLTAIDETWQTFENYLDDIEARLQREDADTDLDYMVTEGIASLKNAHESCLDRMLFALFLRYRQQQVMALLEDIFGIILTFARIRVGWDAEDGGQTKTLDQEKQLSELHKRFKSKVIVFLNVCRGLVGKKGYGKTAGAKILAEENTVERLVLALEMSGYYGSSD